MVELILNLGRGRVYDDLRFAGDVTGGGVAGPGTIYEATGYHESRQVRWEEDCRSGSKRSGSCIWQLEKNKVYKLVGIACSSRDSSTYYVSTFGDLPERLSASEFEAEQRRIWPLGFEQAEADKVRKQQMELERVEREAAQAELRRIEREALAELNAEKAAEIAKNGQPDDGLPELSGTPKQITYALSIRAAYGRKNPNDAALKRGKTAKYWIENHRQALYAN